MGKGEACEQCKHNCLRIHGKNMTSPPIMSFFKIMIGANFSKLMYMPPKFTRAVENLVGEKVNLQDTNGHQWVVTVRKVDNSLVFKQGWPAFSSDHGLNLGDFVIFYFLSEKSFVVHVYDRSGCEKTNFPNKRYPNKRPRTDENFMSKDAPKCHTSDKSSMNKQESNTSAAKSDIEMNRNHCDMNDPSNIEMDQNHCDTSNVPNIVDTPTKNPSNCVTSSEKPLLVFRPGSIEESFIMINRDLGIKQEEDDRTTSMFDLSNFEMRSNVPFVNRSSVRSSPKKSDLTRECIIGQNAVAVPEIFPVKDSFNRKTIETTSVSKAGGNKEDSPDMVIKRCQFVEPSVNISNEPLFGDSQVDASKMCQTQCRSNNTNNLQKASEMSEISRFSALSKLQNYQKEPRDNQINESKVYQNSCNGASQNLILEDKMTMGLKEEKIGVTQEFVDLTQESYTCEETIKGITGKESKFSNTEIRRFSVSSMPHNYRKDKRTVDFKQKKTGVQEVVDLTPECSSQEEMTQELSGKESKFMKGSQSRSTRTINEAVKVLKNEHTDIDYLSPLGLTLSCLVSTNNQSFLELPSSLPSFKGKTIANGNVIYLQDNLMRQFHVIYHERYNFKVLTTGWEAFRRANSIQQGDECVFELESSEDAVFKVSIVRRF